MAHLIKKLFHTVEGVLNQKFFELSFEFRKLLDFKYPVRQFTEYRMSANFYSSRVILTFDDFVLKSSVIRMRYRWRAAHTLFGKDG